MTHLQVFGQKFTPIRRFSAWKTHPFWPHVPNMTQYGSAPRASDLDKYADFIVTAISTAVDKAIPKSKSVRPESDPISDETLVLIKEKHRLRRQYSQKKDPAIKTRINQLQKQKNLR